MADDKDLDRTFATLREAARSLPTDAIAPTPSRSSDRGASGVTDARAEKSLLDEGSGS
jgi:hypothetical protein